MHLMSLLLAETMLGPEKTYLLEPIIQTLEDRLDWLNDREPESEGAVHEAWEEKSSELESIIDDYNNCLDTVNDHDLEDIEDADVKKAALDEIKSAIEEVQGLINNFQNTYGGLSRLNITYD